MAGATWMTSQSALPAWRQTSLPWLPALRDRAATLHEDLEGADAGALSRALADAVAKRSSELIAAIEAYWSHPYRRRLAEPAVIWRDGTTRLLDYGAPVARHGGPQEGAPILIVPSLINRAYILDLKHDCSFVRWLAGQGYRPFLVDWDGPGPEEAGFDLTDYIAGRLDRALDEVLQVTGRAPHLLGYCMGGLLALALAQRRQSALASLVLLATPWDFHAEQESQSRLLGASLAYLSPLMEAVGQLPVDVIQMLFASLDPLLAVRKFRSFGRMDPESPRAETFVALEDWLNDGVPLAPAVARECLAGWYGDNSTARGNWLVAGEAVRPECLVLPSLCVVPAHDRIVPPASARGLGEAIGPCRTIEPSIGHIGMIVGGRAPEKIWQPLAQWLKEQPDSPARQRTKSERSNRAATKRAKASKTVPQSTKSKPRPARRKARKK